MVELLKILAMVNKKGFTLIELIIVIAVIAILATTVILVLNPVNILAEARDSQRIADLGQMSSALGLYLATVNSPDLEFGQTGTSTRCYVNLASGLAITGCMVGTETARHATKTTVFDVDRAINGTGWVPVDLSATSGGSPLSVLPVDPRNAATGCGATATNDTGCYYSYAASGDVGSVTYEIDANMESVRYASGGSDNVESTDGGNRAELYEVGNDPGLDL